MNLRSDIQDQRGVLLVYAALGAVLWPIPLLNVLHAESAAVVALVAFFAAGVSSLRLFNGGRRFGRVLGMQEAALVVPWALLTVAVLWAPNCGYLLGLLLYLLFPVLSVVLAVALAYALSGLRLRFPRAAFVGIGLAVVVLGPLYDLGFHPQFYTYNHVFGGVLGPLYDEELALRLGLFAFRGLTLLWALFLYLAGRRLRSGGAGGVARRASTAAAGGVALLIGLCYLFSAQLGINTPAWYLQRALGGHLRTAHFDIYYDPASLSEEDVRRLAEDHEYRYAWLAERLAMKGPVRIASYLYPSPEVKARLTGARRTSIAPVWLPEPQVHVLEGAYEGSFAHELVHVFSRAFGLPVLKASTAVGLVEGLAVALEPPDGLPAPHEQVVTAALLDAAPGDSLRLARDLAARLSPLGFWTGRGAVSYTTMGSFVRFLLDCYGAERLRRVYARANFEEVYGKSVRVLAEEWEHFLLALPVVARAAAPLVTRRFAVPSLFEVRCPHYVPRHVRAYRSGREALAAGDTTAAAAHFEAALERAPAFTAARAARARLRLARGRPEAVVAELKTDTAAALAVTLGDAYAMLGDSSAARAQYEAALAQLPLYAQADRAQVLLRLALTGRPHAVRLLTSGAPPEEQAARLAALEGGGKALILVRALRLAEAGQYKQAAALLRGMEDTEPPPSWSPYRRALLRRQRLVWLAVSTYRAGAPAPAKAYAEAAAEAFRAVGALNEAAALEDFAGKMHWLQDRSPDVS